MLTKEEIEKMIMENSLYKNALKDVPEENKEQMVNEIKTIVERFYSNILIPFSKIKK